MYPPRLLALMIILDIPCLYAAAHYPAVWGVLIVLAAIVGLLSPHNRIREGTAAASSSALAQFTAAFTAATLVILCPWFILLTHALAFTREAAARRNQD